MFKQYKTETQRLMGMMVNSIYTHKEIFIREIISNASDALDKLSFISLTDPAKGRDRSELEIRVRFDKDKRLLIIEDNGIGMNEEDLENNLGVIARSGSLDFCNENEDGSDELGGIIGQFGVGFYSAFMASDRVIVRTKKYDSDQGYEWSSEGAEGYEITPCDVKDTGTTVIMHIREDEAGNDEYSQFLREYPVYKLIKKYSDYIRWPIRMYMPHPELKPGCDPKNPEYEERFEYETVNSMIPIWKKKKSEVSDEDHRAFYKEHFKDRSDPLEVITASVDGNVSYDAVLYIPSGATADYGSDEYRPGPELYCNGVKIMEHCEALIPDHYNFVRGVVETADLNLNVSREMLQHDSRLSMISGNIEKKIRSALDRMLRDDREKYEKLYSCFDSHLKGCAMEDFGAKQEKLQDLLLFTSSMDNKMVTLSEYVSRMKEGQKDIFYASAPDIRSAEMLPQTQVLLEKGYEVLYFTDKLDELVAQMFGNYHDRVFKSVINGDIDLGDERKPNGDEQSVINFVKETLGSRVDDVRITGRLKDHPVMLTSGDGITFAMEKYFRTLSADMPMHAKKILEINPEHKAFAKLEYAISEDPDRAARFAEVLYQQGRLIAGIGVEDPLFYTELLCELF